jgi:hypothetical protein
MKSAAVGFRVHSGWTSLVVVALDEGLPIVLLKQRPHLVANFTYTFRQPYHTAAKMPLDDAEVFLAQQRRKARKLAIASIRAAQDAAAQQGFKITAAALLLASGRPLPELSKILAAHSLIHTADGEFFRDALSKAARQSNLKLSTTREHDLLLEAAGALKRKPAALTRHLDELGKPLGSPWTQDEKLATLAAWLALR